MNWYEAGLLIIIIASGIALLYKWSESDMLEDSDTAWMDCADCAVSVVTPAEGCPERGRCDECFVKWLEKRMETMPWTATLHTRPSYVRCDRVVVRSPHRDMLCIRALGHVGNHRFNPGHPTPRLWRAMQWVAVLSPQEAQGCTVDWRAGLIYSGEAVNHFGGCESVIRRAIAMRHTVLNLHRNPVRSEER